MRSPFEAYDHRMARKPILITNAAEDPERELRRREVKYVTMMLIRLGCLLGGAAIGLALSGFASRG